MESYINYRKWVFCSSFSKKERQEIFSALNFADKKHFNQIRRHSKQPYLRHPEMVSIMMHKFGLSYVYVIAALLHDVTEDCGVTHKELSAIFGNRIGDLVHFMDKKNLEHFEEKSPDFSNYGEKRSYFFRVDPQAILLRLADSWNNLWEYQGFKNGEKALDAAKNTLELVEIAREILPKNQRHLNFLEQIERIAKRIQEIFEK